MFAVPLFIKCGKAPESKSQDVSLICLMSPVCPSWHAGAALDAGRPPTVSTDRGDDEFRTQSPCGPHSSSLNGLQTWEQSNDMSPCPTSSRALTILGRFQAFSEGMQGPMTGLIMTVTKIDFARMVRKACCQFGMQDVSMILIK